MAKTKVVATLKEPYEISEMVETTKHRLQPLYDKFQANYDIFTFKPFTMPNTKGVFDYVTSNEFGAHGRKVQGLLTNGRPVFSFKLDNERYATRKDKLSNTERFVYSAMSKADKLLLSSSDNTTVHGAVSFYISHFGGCIPRVVVWADEEGKPVFDVALWQPWNVTWQYGAQGLAWVCNERWATTEEAGELYPDADLHEDTNYKGHVKVLDYWTKDWNGVIINDSWASDGKDGENGAPYEHGIGHVPVRIFTSGDIPLLNIGQNGDEQAVKWYSAYDAMRPIMDARNKLLTYRMTLSQKAANRPMVGYYTEGENLPEKPEHPPDSAGAITWLKKDKELLTPSDPIEMTRTVEVMEAELKGMVSMGGMSPIAYGEPAGTSTATGIAMLMEANASYLFPFRRGIEQPEQWIAQELIRQTKNGDYLDNLLAEGFDNRNQRFSVDVATEDLEDEKEIVCELEMSSKVIDTLNAGIADQLVKAGLISVQTAQDTLLKGIVQDTDAEQERIRTEQLLKEHPEINLILALDATMKDRKGSKDEMLKTYLLGLIDKVKNQIQNPAPTPEPQPTGGMPESVVQGIQQPPAIDVPQGVTNAVKIRNLGGGK